MVAAGFPIRHAASERLIVPLTMRGENPTNVFRLLGADENSATFALGWTLDRSPNLLAGVMTAIFGSTLDSTDAVVALQRHGADRGYTDMEIQSGRAFHVVLEAKRDWELPSEAQLERYAPRLQQRAPGAGVWSR